MVIYLNFFKYSRGISLSHILWQLTHYQMIRLIDQLSNTLVGNIALQAYIAPMFLIPMIGGGDSHKLAPQLLIGFWRQLEGCDEG